MRPCDLRRASALKGSLSDAEKLSETVPRLARERRRGARRQRLEPVEALAGWRRSADSLATWLAGRRPEGGARVNERLHSPLDRTLGSCLGNASVVRSTTQPNKDALSGPDRSRERTLGEYRPSRSICRLVGPVRGRRRGRQGERRSRAFKARKTRTCAFYRHSPPWLRRLFRPCSRMAAVLL